MKHTNKSVELKVSSPLYQNNFISIGQTAKNVMLSILKYMDDDMNTIQVGGETLSAMSNHCGYNEQVIRNQLKKLYPMLERTNLRGEYIVNPLFAVKGNEELVWSLYNKIEKGKRELETWREDNW